MFVSSLQPSNICISIEVISFGKVIFVRLAQLSNTSETIIFVPSLITQEVMFLFFNLTRTRYLLSLLPR